MQLSFKIMIIVITKNRCQDNDYIHHLNTSTVFEIYIPPSVFNNNLKYKRVGYNFNITGHAISKAK